MRQLGKVLQIGNRGSWFVFSLLLTLGAADAIQVPAMAREQHPEICGAGSGLLLPFRISEHIPEIGWGQRSHT